jgi:hypothetical protein
MDTELKSIKQLKLVSKNSLKYQESKSDILDKPNKKISCEFCLRLISKECLKKHQKTNLCERTKEDRILKAQKLNEINSRMLEPLKSNQC